MSVVFIGFLASVLGCYYYFSSFFVVLKDTNGFHFFFCIIFVYVEKKQGYHQDLKLEQLKKEIVSVLL
jgi:hypothetical protein